MAYDGIKNFIAGGVGGIALVFVGHPLDTAKVRLQTAPDGLYRNLFHCLQKTVRAEGPKGLYRGMGAPLLSITPIFATYFWGNNLGKQLAVRMGMKKENGTVSTLGIMFGGGFSALPGTVVMVPGDRIKVMLQADGQGGAKKIYSGPLDCAKKMFKADGLRAFYKGTNLTLLRDIPGSVAYYAGYEMLNAKLCQLEGVARQDLSTLSVLFCGGMAGVFNWIVAVPPDTIKSRFQSSPPERYPGGMMQVFKEIVMKDGLMGTYRGLGPAMIRAFPANAACFFGYENAMKFMSNDLGWN